MANLFLLVDLSLVSAGVDFFAVLLLLGVIYSFSPNNKRTADKSTPMLFLGMVVIEQLHGISKEQKD